MCGRYTVIRANQIAQVVTNVTVKVDLSVEVSRWNVAPSQDVLIITQRSTLTLEKARSAVDASAILDQASEYLTVAEAIKDCSLVLGTTAVGERREEHSLFTLAESYTQIGNRLQTERIALLFGSEKTGLSNDALSHCDWLLTIPMHPSPGLRHASMNLGQAVAVCLYEFIRGAPAPKPTNVPPAAQAEDQERLTQLLAEMLACIGYAQRRPAGAELTEVRRMVRRLHLTQSDARRWMGILRQLLWKIGSTSE